eukprot:scaffold226470_cov50-Attheya_sp.AAC.2
MAAPQHYGRRVMSMASSMISSSSHRYYSCGGRSLQRHHVVVLRHHQRASYSSTPASQKKDPEGGGGIGLGNVHDRVLPSYLHDADQTFRHTKSPKTVSVIGAPMTYGQPFVGTDAGPRLLREAGLLKMLSSLGWRVEDVPDLDFESLGGGNKEQSYLINAKHSRMVGRGTEMLAALVEEKLQSGAFPLILGGDHSIAIGSLAGILRARPQTGVVWVDAHADINTPAGSESGNMHGMPLGFLMEGVEISEYPPGLEWLAQEGAPRLNPDSIVYIGLRDVDPEERKIIRDLGIYAYSMYDIDHYGIGKVMDMALAHLLEKDPNRPLHLSYDIDAVDPAHAPATGTAVRGGLTFREAHYVAEALARNGNLASAEIVELNPTLSDEDGADNTIELGLQLLTSALGKSII